MEKKNNSTLAPRFVESKIDFDLENLWLDILGNLIVNFLKYIKLKMMFTMKPYQ